MQTTEPTCANCGQPFQPAQPTQRYCSKRCKSSADGKKNYAKHKARKRERHKQYYEANKDRLIEYAHSYYRENRDEQLADAKRRHAENRDENLAKMRARHAQNREQANADRREWHHANKEHANAKRRAYRQANLEIEKEKQKMLRYQTRLKSPWMGLIHSARTRAMQRGIPFSLTKEWGRETWTGKCAITGIEFRLGTRKMNPVIFSASIDRIDPTKGYEPDNCRFILMGVNALKGSGTDADMYEIAEAIFRNSPLNSKTYHAEPPILYTHAPLTDFAETKL